MLWVDASCSRRDVLAWLAVVHGYEVSFIPTECFYLKKADVSTAIMQSSVAKCSASACLSHEKLNAGHYRCRPYLRAT